MNGTLSGLPRVPGGGSAGAGDRGAAGASVEMRAERQAIAESVHRMGGLPGPIVHEPPSIAARGVVLERKTGVAGTLRICEPRSDARRSTTPHRTQGRQDSAMLRISFAPDER